MISRSRKEAQGKCEGEREAAGGEQDPTGERRGGELIVYTSVGLQGAAPAVEASATQAGAAGAGARGGGGGRRVRKPVVPVSVDEFRTDLREDAAPASSRGRLPASSSGVTDAAATAVPAPLFES